MIEYVIDLLNTSSISCLGMDEDALKSYSDIKNMLIESYKGKVIYRSRLCSRSTRLAKPEINGQGNLCSNCLSLLASIPFLIKTEYQPNSQQDIEDYINGVEKVEIVYNDEYVYPTNQRSRRKRKKKFNVKTEYMSDEENGEVIDDTDNDADFVVDSYYGNEVDDDFVDDGVSKEEIDDIVKEERQFTRSKVKDEPNLKVSKSKKKKSTNLLSEGKEEKIYSCTKCDDQFHKKKALENHMKNTHAEIRCVKVGCEELFVDNMDMSMKSHVKTFHNDDTDLQIRCSKCDDMSTSFTDYKKHESSHKVKTKYQSERFKVAKTCELCGKSFSSVKIWNNHCAKAHKNYKCDECNKVFPTKYAYLDHLSAVHLNEAKYVCSVCGRAYRWRSKRMLCEKTHKGEYYFACPVCGKQFQHKHKLEHHYVVHTGEKPFSCPICPFKCNRRDNLNLHTRKVHAVTLTQAEQMTGKSAKVEATQLSLLPRSEIRPDASKAAAKIKAEGTDSSLPSPPTMKAAPMLTPAQMAAAVRIPTAAQQLTSEISADPASRTLTAEEIVKMDDQDIIQFVIKTNNAQTT